MKKIALAIAALASILFFGCAILIGQIEENKTYDTVNETVNITYATGLKKKDLLGVDRVSGFPKVQLPPSYKLTMLSPVENQEQCGDCWAHSITSTITDTYLNWGNQIPRLSIQWLTDCSSHSSGCNGGFFDSFEDAVIPDGFPTFASYPFVGHDQKCKGANSAVITGISSYHMLGESGAGPTEYDIAYVLSQMDRPVSIDISADDNLMNYKSGVFNTCTQGEVNHMVVIEGFDAEGAEFDANGTLPAGKGTWFVRNSWGTDYGVNGFFTIKMTDKRGNRCNAVATDAAYVNIPGDPL